MKSNFSKILIYVTLFALGAFLAFWLRTEFVDEKTALETEMHLHFVEDLIGLEKTDMKDFFNRKNRYDTDKKLTVYDSVQDRRIMFFSDEFSQRLIDSIKLLIKNGRPVWESDSDKIKIKRIDVGISQADTLLNSSYFSDSVHGHEGQIKMIETSSNNFADKETELNLNALKGILPQTIFAVLLYSLLVLGIFLLQKNHKDQQALLENKNSLIRNVTHELQTPLATISVALEAIQNFNIKEDKAKTNEYINISRQQIKNLSESVDRVMLMSKMDDDKEVFYFEKTALMPLFKEVLDDLTLQAAAKNIQIELEEKNIEKEVKVDKYHFKNVLFNIVDNAIKYGKKGGHLKIEIKELPDNVLIKIKDDGIGVAPKNIEKIFERFYRITDGNRHDVKGYGLGLSYARQVVEAHDGKIWVESKEGEGSNFFIEIKKT